MKKIKIFAAKDINTLQTDVNSWLFENKDAHVIESNMTSSTTSSGTLSKLNSQNTEYAFYLLYTPAGESEEESVIAATKQIPEELTQAINTITEAN